MKKTFKLTAPNKHPDRVVEGIKHELRKYIKREKKKPLGEDFDFWQFNCRFGKDAENSQKIEFGEIINCVDGAASKEWESFYMEILASKAKREPKPTSQDEENEAE